MTPPKVIALEEHFTSPGLRALRGEKDTPVQRKLDDLGELRIREMDEAGSICKSFLRIIRRPRISTQKRPSSSRVPLTMCCSKPCTSTRAVLPALLLCRPRIRKRRPASWSAL